MKKLLLVILLFFTFIHAATFPIDIKFLKTYGTRVELTGWFSQNRTYGTHKSFDFSALQGTPVRAYETGIVEIGFDYPKFDAKTKSWRSGYGNYVKLKTYEAKKTLLGEIKTLKRVYVYGHLDTINGLKSGDSVSEGDTIAFVGSTGLVGTQGKFRKAFHLHFECQNEKGIKQNICLELAQLVKEYFGIEQTYSFKLRGNVSNTND